jgi:hypothetical protein
MASLSDATLKEVLALSQSFALAVSRRPNAVLVSAHALSTSFEALASAPVALDPHLGVEIVQPLLPNPDRVLCLQGVVASFGSRRIMGRGHSDRGALIGCGFRLGSGGQSACKDECSNQHRREKEIHGIEFLVFPKADLPVGERFSRPQRRRALLL